MQTTVELDDLPAGSDFAGKDGTPVMETLQAAEGR